MVFGGYVVLCGFLCFGFFWGFWVFGGFGVTVKELGLSS